MDAQALGRPIVVDSDKVHQVPTYAFLAQTNDDPLEQAYKPDPQPDEAVARAEFSPRPSNPVRGVAD